MCVAAPRPPANLAEILVVHVSQDDLEEQRGHDHDADDLMRCREGVVFDVHDAECDGDGEADNTDRGGAELEYPVEPEGVEESEQANAEGEEDDKGAAEADGVDDDERGDGAW